MSRKDRQRDADYFRQSQYNAWLLRMEKLICSSIYWEGLPDEIDPVQLEKYISLSGSAIIIKDDVSGLAVAAVNDSTGTLDAYGVPTDRRGTLANGRPVYGTPADSVIIYNDSLRGTDLDLLESTAARLADLDVIIRVNTNLQKTVPLIPTTDTQRLSVDNVMSQIDTGQLFIPVDTKSFDALSFKDALVMDNARSFTADKVIAIQDALWCRFLTEIGVNNNNTEKKERLITAEVDANTDEVYIYRRDRLNCRQRAARQMQNLFGWDVSVHYYSDLTENKNINIGGERDLNHDGVADKNTPPVEAEEGEAES